MLQRLAFMAACCVVFFSVSALAGEQNIEAGHTYVMGENDTRAEARRVCFLEARRKAVEQAGTFVESETKVVDLSLSRDEIRAFASAFVKAELVEEEFVVTGETFAVRCRVRAVVDTDTLGARLADYAVDPLRRERLSGLADRQTEAERRALEPAGSAAVPMTRSRALRSLEELEAEKAKLRRETERLSRSARHVVSSGMTMAEVESLLGSPRVKKLNDAMTSVYQCHNYGDVWVVFKDGLVACTRDRLEYSGSYRSDCHCAGIPGAVSYD